MADCNDKKTPLKRHGTARDERLLPGLQDGYVLVDEKKFADWIVFAREFAQYISYYELNESISGTWVPFFSNDVSAVLGTISIQDVEAYKRAIKDRFDFLKDDSHITVLPQAERKLNDLFSAVLTFCHALDEFYRLLPNDVSLKSKIENQIQTHLAAALNRLLRYYKGAKQLGYILTGTFADWKILGSPVKDAAEIITVGLSKLWWKKSPAPASWNAYYAGIQKDESIFGNAALDIYFNSLYNVLSPYTAQEWLQYMKMNHAANHNLFAGAFDQFLQAFSKLVIEAEKDLLLSLESRNTHQPHYALFLAFLRLFRFAQNDINTITKRHLDFYYKEVLQLRQKPASPNQAHILAELAKPVNDFILEKDTLFKAGKDSTGKDVSYGLVSETTFNKAQVVSLKSVYVGNATDDYTSVVNDGRMFAAPMINSADGIKEKLATANNEWHPIANRIYIDGKVTNIKMPKAEIGFAVASHYLFLQESDRTITLRLDAGADNALLIGKKFNAYLTAEKEWYQLQSAPAITENNTLGGTDPCVEFTWTLGSGEPPIVNYNSEVHGGNLAVNVPVIKVMVANDELLPYEYEHLRSIRVRKVQVAVKVGSDSAAGNRGIKQLLISANGGVVDPSKPFQPFGAQPRIDAAFIIGSREIFSKANAKIRVNIQWAGLVEFAADKIVYPNSTSNIPGANVHFLKTGLFTYLTHGAIFTGVVDGWVQLAEVAVPIEAIVPFDEAYEAYGPLSTGGFMRLMLRGAMGHKEAMNQRARYLIEQSKPSPSGTISDAAEPYTPVIQALYIGYRADSEVVNLDDANELSFNNKSISFFHLYPFGDAQQHAYLTKNTSHYLLPQFRHIDEDGKQVLHVGEFYIGFENLAALQSVNVLFQVLDGSADPKISKPVPHIHWSYLTNNQWLDFKKQEISDATMQLVKSGIISFVIPGNAKTDNTVLPGNYLWIKAAVSEKVDAICKLISVDAQAAVAEFEDNANAADFLNTALPAGSISKLKTPQSGVKKVRQPYSSFDGAPLEGSDAFYVRVSERLRHKARAITIWDYEHLILEAFPMIHKVKCLNHTLSVDDKYNEVLPGHVTIITIPDLRERNDVNPLKPYTSQSILQSIDAFLRKKISCHVKLHVVNPVFEEVQLKFFLKLAQGYDDFTIYSNKLREEITAFLSPWAYGSDADINFGGHVYKSVLINFIEERPYVDFITDVEMCHYDDNGVIIQADNDEIIASTAKSILVSVPASKHSIDPVPAEQLVQQYECKYLEDLAKEQNVMD